MITETESILSPAISVLIVDDHFLVSETMVAVLSAEPDLNVQSAKDIEAALDCIQRNGAYDVVLLDYDMPGTRSLEGFEHMLKANKK